MLPFPYTLCFCLCGDQVLMLYRRKPPNARRWNGLGGKIEPGETPLQAIRREVREEAGLDLSQVGTLHFAGIVTWTSGQPAHLDGGTYLFLATLPADFPLWPDRATTEGLLAWKPLRWVCDASNRSVVGNISRFLPAMLKTNEPLEYTCHYVRGSFSQMRIHALSHEILSDC